MDGIIFDVDGTLWDTTSIVADAWNHCLRENGISDITLTSDRLKTLFGKLLPDIAAAILPAHSKEEQLRLIDLCCEEEHDAIRAAEPPLYPEIAETLQLLSERYPLFIVSNCQAGYIELFLERTKLTPFITDHLCPGDTGVAKAENIQMIVSRHKLSSPFYVGDTAMDAEACRKAGVPFIHAAYGFGTVESPYAVIRKPSDLIELCR